MTGLYDGKTGLKCVNPFYAIGLFLFPQKTLENRRVSDVSWI